MVEPALWRRKRLSSIPLYQGVCGRHDVEDLRVTQGEVQRSWRQVSDPISENEMGSDASEPVGERNSTSSKGQHNLCDSKEQIGSGSGEVRSWMDMRLKMTEIEK
jgi:hypothetical protein